ncbi:MAG: hypothetical protein WDN75_13625 [Bacteroidota bacterium]
MKNRWSTDDTMPSTSYRKKSIPLTITFNIFHFVIDMAARFTRDRMVLYLCITAGFLIHWTHEDLTSHPGEFAVSLVNSFWQVIGVVGLNLLYFEYALPFVTSKKTYRVPAIVASLVVHIIALTLGIYIWRLLGSLIGVYHPFVTYSSHGEALAQSSNFVAGSFLVSPYSNCFLITHN